GSRQHLLQGDIRDGILDHQAGTRFAFRNPAPGTPVHFLGAEELLRDLVAPIAKRALGELHDVPLVHEGDTFSLVDDGVADRAVHEPLGAQLADRFQANADLYSHIALRRADRFELLLPHSSRLGRAKPNLFELLRKFPGEEIQDLLRLRRARGIFDAGVNVFGVLAEDHHVDFLRVFDRRRHAVVPANRSQAHKQVEHLPQRNIERPNAAADRRGQRPFDPNEIPTERIDGGIRQPVVELFETLFARVDFHLGSLSRAVVRFVYCGVEHADARSPDVGTGSVALDEWNDWMVGHD